MDNFIIFGKCHGWLLVLYSFVDEAQDRFRNDPPRSNCTSLINNTMPNKVLFDTPNLQSVNFMVITRANFSWQLGYLRASLAHIVYYHGAKSIRPRLGERTSTSFTVGPSDHVVLQPCHSATPDQPWFRSWHCTPTSEPFMFEH